MAAPVWLLGFWDRGVVEVVIGEGIVVAESVLLTVARSEERSSPENYWLIHGEPACNSVTIAAEDYTSIVYEIFYYLVAQPSSICVLEVQRQIPVV